MCTRRELELCQLCLDLGMFEDNGLNGEYFFWVIGSVYMRFHSHISLDLRIGQIDVSFVEFVL